MKVSIIYTGIAICFVILIVGFSLATWKMFHFRNRLLEFIDNDRWEKTLSANKIYDDNLIVFFGDSQINLWWTAPHFGSLPIVNAGRSGDWTSRAVRRFDKEVLALKPKLLVILIGTNDLERGESVKLTTTNIEALLKKATQKNIKILLCSVLPVRGEHLKIRALKDILQINNNLKSISNKYDAEYIDFHSQMIDENGTLNAEYTEDGLHPNRSGYLKMSKIIMPHLLNNAIKFLK
jgi:lysophospholipase L1-like esterase